MITGGLDEWPIYLKHGEEYYHCARDGYNHPEKFNEDALFNLAAIAIEKLSMGFLMKHSILPEGHMFSEIAESLNSVTPLPKDLEEEIKGLDKYQASFCSLEIFRPDPVTRENIPPMLETCRKLMEYVNRKKSA